MNLFYQEHINESISEIIFDKDESRHIAKVLRTKIGNTLHITNGKGLLFEAQLESENPKKCIARIQSVSKEAPLPYYLHLAVAPTKLNDRYEWFLEKATEIGVSEITPIICDHSERKVIKHDRYQKIVVGAMKQSLKMYLPKLNQATSYKEFINQENKEIKLIAHCEESKKVSLKSFSEKLKNTTILIGPEGDFSTTEIELAIKNEYKSISLGDTRLRTETAAIVACHSVAFANHN
ncbi:16S rRNA (uracil(1498)-N(3))-methyltransferase [Patiriisocius hiemis]|uniref:Ribosomal RNA small subunit methyltransferase E n=1 Tax=Patiriisocius hiemis TaxID=3075604 RepID=A0ABU2YC16_9FLAO|nr:16S rRNA (uracil(1498)-N(3))-methyltransferase [Constantimarinum sp. W242]MDT0554785.1 16S rRNA (uracil(1498)-N(3))-methyltransferase [Constantimarinum sp. W242]